MQALAALVAEDVRFVNVGGSSNDRQDRNSSSYRGERIVMQFKERMRTVAATDIKFLTADIVVLMCIGV
jgi:hypothetical protein